MSLRFPINLALRDDIEEVLLRLLKSLPGPLTHYSFDGMPSTTSIQSDELSTVAKSVAACSIVYAIDGINGMGGPVAGFVANQSLRTARLLHFIDDQPPTETCLIERHAMDMLAVYICYLYRDFDWVDRVTIPSDVKLIDNLFNLRVNGDGFSCVTLKDAKKRPSHFGDRANR